MNTIITSKTATMVLDIPKTFWQYYDLYRREKISLEEYVIKTKLPKEKIIYYLSVV